MSNDDRLKTTIMGATQKSWFRRNRFCRVTPTQVIRYLKSFYKANLDINKPLRLWVIIYTFLKFRTFGATPILTIIFCTIAIIEKLDLVQLTPSLVRIVG